LKRAWKVAAAFGCILVRTLGHRIALAMPDLTLLSSIASG
jgi:hypothetical protein